MNRRWEKFVLENIQNLIVSFDFDGTLTADRFSYSPYSTVYDVKPNIENIERLKKLKQNGCTIYIVTRRLRDEDSIKQITSFIREFELPINGLYFTNLQDKVFTLSKLGCQLHFDDDREEIEMIKQYAPHIKTIHIKREEI